MTNTKSDPAIIPAHPAMTALLASLHRHCFDAPWDEKAFADLLQMPGAVGFVINAASGVPAGFVLANCALDQADIITIGICPDQRRRDLGSALLKHLAINLQASGIDEIYLEVAADNAAAIRLYRKCGYVKTGERANYYSPERSNRTALQMKCVLGG